MDNSNSSGGAKPGWQRFLESSGGTALITVLLGGMAGQLITCSVQNRTREREFEQAWMKSRGDQALQAYKEYVVGEQKIVERAYELIGHCISAGEEMIMTTRPEFNPVHYPEHLRPVLEQQLIDMRSQWNVVDSKWRSEGQKLGLLMSYYHHGHAGVERAWDDVQKTTTNYFACARQWNVDKPRSTAEDANAACAPQKSALLGSLTELKQSLEKARRYAWKGWESPQELKKALAGTGEPRAE